MAILLDLSIDAGYTVYLLILYYKIIVIFPSFFDPFVEIIVGIDMGDQCLYLALFFIQAMRCIMIALQMVWRDIFNSQIRLL